MKFSSILSFFLIVCLTGLPAQQPSGSPGDVETKWPGIHYQIFAIQRIGGDRVAVAVRVVATADAPKQGTLIGIKVPIPPGATKEDIKRGLYAPQPFSLAPSMIIDEKTNQQYPAVKPIGNYIGPEILCHLRPGQAESLAVQFDLPPPPPDAMGRRPLQTATLLLFNADKPLTRVVIPPPAPAPAATPLQSGTTALH